MITSKAELKFYIMADRIMNGLPAHKTIKECVASPFLSSRYAIVHYLEAMRRYSFYKQMGGGKLCLFRKLYNKIIYKKLGMKLGFSIGEDVFGYGLVIPHYGTIVVGNSNRIGNYAVLHTSTCISAKESQIGDGLYLSTGAKITQKVSLGCGTMIGANSVVNKSFEGHSLIVGAPAKAIKKRELWYSEEPSFQQRVDQIEQLRKKLR